VEKIENQIIRSGLNVLGEYSELKELTKTVMDISGQIWNWPMGLSLTTPTIARILHLSDMYQKTLGVPGVVCEFGVHYGTASSILINLKQIYEPRNISKRFFLFDTFEGFIHTTSLDGDINSQGDHKLIKNYKEILNKVLTIQQKINENEKEKMGGRRDEFTIYEGDATVCVEEFLNENPEAMISMVILDMDLYHPTKKVLEKIIPRLSKGSIVVLDEFNHPDYPGETIALREVLELNKIKLIKSKFLPYAVYFEW
jgi:hypothetical protein